jgi:predicted nucleic acid-binding protein
VILDASVVLKAYLPEDGAESAYALLVRPDVASTSVLITEFGHVLSKRTRGHIVAVEGARRIWSAFRAAPIRIVDDATSADAALELSLHLHAGFYDCLYLALAVAEDDVLVTADERFAAAVRTRSPLGRRIALLGEP